MITKKICEVLGVAIIKLLLSFQWEAYKQLPEVSVRKGVLRNFANFTGKYLRQGLFFNKVAG